MRYRSLAVDYICTLVCGMRLSVVIKTCLLSTLFGVASLSSSQVPSQYVPLNQEMISVDNHAHTNTEDADELSAQQAQAQDSDPIGENEASGADVGPALNTVRTSSDGIALPQGAIVALGNDPNNPQRLKAFTGDNYPGIARGAIQKVRDTQAEYAESLASQDIVNMLGHPFSEITQGSGRCADGSSGDYTTFYYLIREGAWPKSMAVVRFCADGMQSIATQSLR